MKKFIRSVFLLFALSVCSQAAYGCMCTPPKHLYKVSKAVFFGELVKIAQSDVTSQRVVKFKVEKYWKGVNGESASVMTTAVYPCGYNFRVGEKYLIYAGEDNGQLETAPCRILARDVAGENLKKLGKGKIPKPGGSLSFDAPPNNSLNPTRLSIAFINLVARARVIYDRRRAG
ncbi:MAG TPA: hypothetical protein VE732_04580 [Nitrososphaera sp.]|jgi:hypothetical protein|nr:hypothetical protein [Nitrososphaera sp.]